MTLPVLLSIPHGGTTTPPELAALVAASPADVRADGDPLTREIYDLGDAVEEVVAADVARAFVDCNRDPDDRPPANPDGVVKTATCEGVPLYRGGDHLPDPLVATLLERYHAPYHRRLEAAVAGGRIALALDCHSMGAVGPPIAPDPGRPRPAFCVSDDEGRTCPAPVRDALCRELVAAFDVPPHDLRVNDPFSGGYVVRTHGARGRVPWLQVEMSRRFYLAEPWLDADSGAVDARRLSDLRDRFRVAVRATVEQLT